MLEKEKNKKNASKLRNKTKRRVSTAVSTNTMDKLQWRIIDIKIRMASKLGLLSIAHFARAVFHSVFFKCSQNWRHQVTGCVTVLLPLAKEDAF